MQNIVKSMLDEVGAMMSGHVIPYHKVAIVVAAVIALLFSLVFSHSTVFEGKIAVIDLDASNYSTALIQKINTSPYIEVTQVLHSPMNPEILTAHDRNIGVLYIPKGLEKSLKTGDRTVRLGYFADHSNSAQNAEVLQNLNEYIPELGAELGAEHIAALGFGREGTEAVLSPMQLKNRHLFNPTNTATNSTSIAFVYFFSSLFYGLATLMVVGRLKVTGTWDQAVFNRGPLALMCRMVPRPQLLTMIQFNIIYIMRTNGKDGRNWLESLTLGVDWLLSAMIQNHPFLQTNQNRMSVNSK